MSQEQRVQHTHHQETQQVTNKVSFDAYHSSSSETFQELCALLHKRVGAIPESLLAQQIMYANNGADWPVMRAAAEAITRRWNFAQRDELRVDKGPAQKQVFGEYRLRPKGKKPRPYTTLVLGVDPLQASCGCADFVRSGLGVCKHVLVALERLYVSKTARKRLDKAQGQDPASNGKAHLGWDPVRPLTGSGHWLERLQWVASNEGHSPEAMSKAASWFALEKGQQIAKLKPMGPSRAKRHAMLRDLQAALAHSDKSTQAVTIDPAAKRLLTAEGERIDAIEKLPSSVALMRKHLRKLKRKLYPYQFEGVQRFMENGRLLLADDMGLGKTAQAIACCHVLVKQGVVARGLIVVPASLKSQWKREWGEFTDLPIQVVEGSPEQRRALYRKTKHGFLITNYEQVLRDLAEIIHWNADFVVLDEAQRIKNWATKTAGSIKRLTPPYRLVLTGTPMENRLGELASLVEWVDPLALEPLWRLVPWHTQTVDGSREVSGARHLETLRQRLSHCMVRRLREEVLDQLPPRTDTTIPVPLTTKQAELHDEFAIQTARLMQRTNHRPLTHAEFLRLMSLMTNQRVLCNGVAQFEFEEVWPTLAQTERPSQTVLDGLSSPKLIELRELVRNVVVDQGRKVVIFSQWRRMLKLAEWALRDILGESGLHAMFFTGAESQKRRTHNVIDFHDDPRARILLATDAGGVGLNLQRASNCCINLDMPWNPAVLEQRIGRIYRLGQTQAVDIYNLVGTGGLEERICDIVGTKQALFKGLFDGSSDAVQFEKSGSFLTRARELIAADLELNDIDDDDDQVNEEHGSLAEQAQEEAQLSQENTDAMPQVLAAQSNTKKPDSKNTGVSSSVHDLPSAAQLSGLLEQLEFRPTQEGGVTIDAPPAAAAALASLFAGLAQRLQG